MCPMIVHAVAASLLLVSQYFGQICRPSFALDCVEDDEQSIHAVTRGDVHGMDSRWFALQFQSTGDFLVVHHMCKRHPTAHHFVQFVQGCNHVINLLLTRQ